MAALIVAGVTALGFTSQGIAAGSFAAWLMSVTGPVASGSVVAICQSIGATGAVSATTAAIANTTAAVAMGGAAVKVARSIKRRLNKDRVSETSDRGGPIASPSSNEEEADSEDEQGAEEASVNLDLTSVRWSRK